MGDIIIMFIELFENKNDRGQILIVTAAILVFTILALTVILNSLIYVENLETRSETVGTYDSLEISENQRIIYKHTLQRENNRIGVTYSEYNDAMTRNHQIIRNSTISKQNRDGSIFDSSLDVIEEGTLIAQDSNGQFLDANGKTNWTLGNDLTTGRDYTMNLTGNNLVQFNSTPTYSDLGSNNTFYVTFDGSYETYIYTIDGETGVVFHTFTTSGSNVAKCQSKTNNPTAQLYESRVDGEYCSAFDEFDSSSTSSIKYSNGNNIEGTYSLIAQTDFLNIDQNAYYDDTSGSDPYSSKAIYSIEVTITNKGYKDELTTTIRIAPGEN